MKQTTLISHVQNGQLQPNVQRIVKHYLDESHNKTIQIELKRFVKKRSCPQNAFYWGVVVPLIQAMFAEHGNETDRDVVHQFLKGEVGGMKKHVTAPDGTVVDHIDSSTNLSTLEWEDWLEKIRAWAAPFGVQVPFPNESIAS